MRRLFIFSFLRSFPSSSYTSFSWPFDFPARINHYDIDAHLPQHQILFLDLFKEQLFISFSPLFDFLPISSSTALLFHLRHFIHHFGILLSLSFLFFLLMSMWFQLVSHVNFHAFLNNLTESLNLIYSLSISLFHLLDYL